MAEGSETGKPSLLAGVALRAVLTLTSSAFPSLGEQWPTLGLLRHQGHSKTV